MKTMKPFLHFAHLKAALFFGTNQKEEQVKSLLPKFQGADSAVRSQAAGGGGVYASVAQPAFGCRLG